MVARRRASTGAATLLAVVVTFGSAHADWLQHAGDAMRASVAAGPGPETDDVAFRLLLPGIRPSFASPVVLGRDAYVLAAREEVTPIGTTRSGRPGDVDALLRVGLDTAQVETVAELGRHPIGLASDGALVYVAREGGVDAIAPDGSLAWSWEHDPLVRERDGTFCAPPAVEGRALFLACAEYTVADGGLANYGVFVSEAGMFVAALDLDAGAERWYWRADAGIAAGADVTGDEAPVALAAPFMLARAGGTVVVNALQVASASGACEAQLWFFAPEDGAFLGAYDLSHARGSTEGRLRGVLAAAADDPAAAFAAACQPAVGPQIVGTEALVFASAAGRIVAVNPSQRTFAWEVSYSDEDAGPDGVAGGLALADGRLYGTGVQALYVVDVAARAKVRNTLAVPGEAWGSTPLVIAGDRLYARMAANLTPVSQSGAGGDLVTILRAYDAETLGPVWRFELGTTPVEGFGGTRAQMAVASGVLVVHAVDGQLVVLGRTAASPTPVATSTTDFPAPGTEVVVDLSGSRPGLLGAPAAFRAEWGDGETTEWQPGPVLRHTYRDAGERSARFQVRNDAGQTASMTQTFHVGATPPPAPTLLETAFSAENQNATFFALGLLLTASGAGFGFVRLHRRRTLLQRELRAVEEAHERTRDEPHECEAMLVERKVRARGLLLDGKLDETQFAVLERRVDELARHVRLSTLDARFDFLPHGMVRTLRDMLADGRISEWEHRHFVEALDRDAMLLPEYKQRVRALVDSWFAADAARVPAPRTRDRA